MNEPKNMDWREFTVRIIEALRWPAAFIAVIVILREPIHALVAALLRAASS
ncbi:MAG TPA: hypothetical protein VF649_05570 [Sphingomonas sp.]|jgi:hypothetical protein|uniref:hypothetical protein n=1 Tax=Sphingomonas sp. TaxID=28214 RepID=UPI002ED845BA